MIKKNQVFAYYFPFSVYKAKRIEIYIWYMQLRAWVITKTVKNKEYQKIVFLKYSRCIYSPALQPVSS